MKLIKHIKLWNLWRKYCVNGLGVYIPVLFGLRKSPTFDMLKCLDLFWVLYYVGLAQCDEKLNEIIKILKQRQGEEKC